MISLTLWALSIALALTPLHPDLHDYFVDEYHYTDNPILLGNITSILVYQACSLEIHCEIYANVVN